MSPYQNCIKSLFPITFWYKTYSMDVSLLLRFVLWISHWISQKILFSVDMHSHRVISAWWKFSATISRDESKSRSFSNLFDEEPFEIHVTTQGFHNGPKAANLKASTNNLASNDQLTECMASSSSFISCWTMQVKNQIHSCRSLSWYNAWHEWSSLLRITSAGRGTRLPVTGSGKTHEERSELQRRYY